MIPPKRVVALPSLPARPRSGHKGLFGKVLIVGGSEGMIGAPAFAALAALRMGCGLAYIAARASLLPFILCNAPEAVGVPLRRPVDAKSHVLASDSIVVGPGLGRSPLAAGLLRMAIGSKQPLVIDADGLNMLAAGKVQLRRPHASTVLTPHPGEMLRLGTLCGFDHVPGDDAGRLKVALIAARTLGQVIVLKGERTVITDGQKYAINLTGDSTLSKAGSGDILSGMIGTLLAQGISSFDAARLAVHYHGLAGEMAGKRLGRRSALASDVIEAIPHVLHN